jgi:hypothetical protein
MGANTSRVLKTEQIPHKSDQKNDQKDEIHQKQEHAKQVLMNLEHDTKMSMEKARLVRKELEQMEIILAQKKREQQQELETIRKQCEEDLRIYKEQKRVDLEQEVILQEQRRKKDAEDKFMAEQLQKEAEAKAEFYRQLPVEIKESLDEWKETYDDESKRACWVHGLTNQKTFEEWQEVRDKTTGKPYWYNRVTKGTSWRKRASAQ